MKAFVCRVGPRVVAKQQPRGTLINPAAPDPTADHSEYFERVVAPGKLPAELVLEFGQPPTKTKSHTLEVGDVVLLLLGATDFRGSKNPRGIIGIGRIQNLEYSGKGPSERCQMSVDRVTNVSPLLSNERMTGLQWFRESKLKGVKAFGFQGKQPAQNILKCYDDSWTAGEREAQVRAILGLLSANSIEFREDLARADPELASMVPEIDPSWQSAEEQVVTGSQAAQWTPAENVVDLAARLYLPVDTVQDMLWILEKKQSLILSGPPGVGKTYVARELGKYAFGENFDFVQFHPSYSYEYFVSGYRPVSDGSTLRYELSAGPLLDTVHRANEDFESGIESKHGLVIDEINRANVSAVFGELMSAMEYRHVPVHLQYGSPYDDKGLFEVPENFYIIATMNRADRSVGNFDAALRRRFGVYECSLLSSPFRQVLRNFLAEEQPSSLWVADWIQAINEEVPDPDYAIGASYFFGLDSYEKEDLRRILDFEILPYLKGKFSHTEFIHRQDLFDIESVINRFEMPTVSSSAK